MKFFDRPGRSLLVGLMRLLWGPSKNAALKPRNPQRILLLRTDRIGDLVVSTAAIHAIRKRFPDAHLEKGIETLVRYYEELGQLV